MSLKFSTEFTPQRIRDLRVIFDAATPGPWEALTRAVRIADFNMFVGDEDDTDFIIAARETFPEAIDRIEVLEMRCRWQKEAIQRVRAVLAEWRANEFHKYKFATESDVVEAVSKACHDHKDDLADEIGEGGWAPLLGPLADEVEAALIHDDSEKTDD